MTRIPHTALRVAFTLAVFQALFFVVFTAYPFSTVGDPAFDRPLIRLRSWEGLWQPYIFLAYCAVLTTAALVARNAQVFLIGGAAILLMLGAHVTLLWEYAQIVQIGPDASGPAGTAPNNLLTRVLCAVMALGSVLVMRRAIGRM